MAMLGLLTYSGGYLDAKVVVVELNNLSATRGYSNIVIIYMVGEVDVDVRLHALNYVSICFVYRRRFNTTDLNA